MSLGGPASGGAGRAAAAAAAHRGSARAGSAQAWAIGLSAGWLVVAGAAWALLGTGSGGLVAAIAVLSPLGLIWLAAAFAAEGARAREERARLRAEIDALRGDLRTLQRETEARDRDAPPRRGGGAAEPEAGAPGIGTPETGAPEAAHPAAPAGPRARAPRPRPAALKAADFIRALDFPEHAEDEAGFAALRLALADPNARRLVQASQDVLTLLSQNGVYMDDLAAEPAPAALWRRFAGGVRGPSVAALGSVRDEAALELAGTRMARDTIFRDAAQHFLRQFDLGLQRFVAGASDADIERLARTRTARAFMLLARAAGVFD